jgi:hypothetical protein
MFTASQMGTVGMVVMISVVLVMGFMIGLQTALYGDHEGLERVSSWICRIILTLTLYFVGSTLYMAKAMQHYTKDFQIGVYYLFVFFVGTALLALAATLSSLLLKWVIRASKKVVPRRRINPASKEDVADISYPVSEAK